MTPLRRLWSHFLAILMRGVLAVFWSTCRITRVEGEQHLLARRDADEPSVIVYWHQMHIFCTYYLLKQIRQGLKLALLISASVTGEVPTILASRWGATIVRGSSNRKSGEAMRELFGVVRKGRASPVLTADGPKGPIHECKPGVVMLARLTGAPLLPMAYAASRCVRWKSWDEFIVPLPFSRICVAIGEPVHVPASATPQEMEALRLQAQEAMQAMAARAEELIHE